MSVVAGLDREGGAGAAPATTAARAVRPRSRTRRLSRVVLVEALALAAILALTIALRLVGIAQDTGLSDEGIRAVQLRLMAAGYWPVREIYAAQGPLSLPATYPLYAQFGGDLVAARLAVAAYSIGGVLAIYGIGRRVAGPIAGVAAAALLAVGPLYLESSRLALVEVPSMVPALFALAALARFRDGGGRGWLVGSAALLAIGLLIKPMVLMAGASALVLLVWPVLTGAGTRLDAAGAGAPGDAVGAGARGDAVAAAARDGSPAGRPWRRTVVDLLIYGATGLAVVALTVAAIGPAETYAQLVEYRAGARAVGDATTADNWARIGGQLGREGIGLLVAAGVGALVLARRPRTLAVVLAWLGAGLALMLAYTPLYPKHVVYLVPPLVVLAGAALGEAARALAGLASRSRPGEPGVGDRPDALAGRSRPDALGTGAWSRVLGAMAIVAACAVLATLPRVVEEDRRLLVREPDGDIERYADDLSIVAAATEPGDFVVMDDPYLAGMTGRLMPPHMADLSYTRILARTLASTRAKSDTEAFDARAVVVQDDRLGQLPRYLEWVDRTYVLAKSYVRRAPNRYRRVYVHPDADLAAARAALVPSIEHPFRAEAGAVAVLGYSLDRRELRPRELFWLTIHWEALRSSPPGHDVVIRLRGADGTLAQESEFPIGDGEQIFKTWSAGQWQLQTVQVEIDRRVRPGTYTLALALDSSDNAAGSIRVADNAVPVTSDGELVLGTIVVR